MLDTMLKFACDHACRAGPAPAQRILDIMRDTSLSESIPAPAPASSGAQGNRAVRHDWRRNWRQFWQTQRTYWRLTLTMLLIVAAIMVIGGVYLWQLLPADIAPEQAAPYRQALVIVTALATLLLTVVLVGALQINGRQMRQMTRVIHRLANGNHDARAAISGSRDLGALGRAVNRLAERSERHALQRKRERDRFDAVLEATSDGVLLLDRRGAVMLMNPSAARLLRTDAARALRLSFVQVVRDYRVADVWQQCSQNNTEQMATIELNPGFFLRVYVVPLLKAPANGFLVLLQDLSHLYRLEAVRRDFVSNISHELRTPLASIKALVDTLRDGAISDPPVAERFLQRMEVEVDSMTQMVQELLELSRIESGQAPLRLFPTEVATLVEPAVDRLRAQATRAEVTMTVVLSEDLPQVMVDADRIRQVIINLVHNAIKFTPSGGFVTVTARAVHDGLVISVADTGTGILAEDVSRIFERFYKADRARSSGGTGLGLAIAKHTVQAHNGRIWVESTEGKGSTFSFSLPLINLPLTQL